MQSDAQAGSPAHLKLLEPLLAFHKATTDVIYVYTAILEGEQIYFVLGTVRPESRLRCDSGIVRIMRAP